jgi:hypothetical protein
MDWILKAHLRGPLGTTVYNIFLTCFSACHWCCLDILYVFVEEAFVHPKILDTEHWKGEHSMFSMESPSWCHLYGKSWGPHSTWSHWNLTWEDKGGLHNNAWVGNFRWPTKRTIMSHKFLVPQSHCPALKTLYFVVLRSGSLWIACFHNLIFLLNYSCFIQSHQSSNLMFQCPMYVLCKHTSLILYNMLRMTIF